MDMWSRLAIGAVVKRKTPEEIVNSIFQKWIAYYGVMGGLLHDNGGEFTGEEMQELKSKLNRVSMTTKLSHHARTACEKRIMHYVITF